MCNNGVHATVAIEASTKVALRDFTIYQSVQQSRILELTIYQLVYFPIGEL
jgi:hypothetical protein